MPRPPPLDLGGLSFDWSRPVVMGILNITPDSFSDGGTYADVGAVVQRALELVAHGAQILDVGGESTRPGADPVDVATELARVVPVVRALANAKLPVALSIDTRKAAVADAALAAGAVIVNDVTALTDAQMASVAARHGAIVILMHMRGDPQTMQQGPIAYDDVVTTVRDYLAAAMGRALSAGIARERIWLDPGIGFGKDVTHNLLLTKGLATLALLGQPVVYGPSRKRFLGAITGRDVGDRDAATAAACAAAILYGAHVLRVHDAEATRDAIAIATAVRDAS